MEPIILTQDDIDSNPILQELGAEPGDSIQLNKEGGDAERGAPPAEGPGGSNPPGNPRP